MSILEKISHKDTTVSQYLVNKLFEVGINDVLGVPGDYNFPIIDTIEKNDNVNFINCCNELNAGYAADGYSRIKGISALITTFGVGELSALNSIAGAYCEDVPIIHIVGGPKSIDQKNHKLMHHSLLNGDFEVFHKMSAKITQTTAVLTAQNAKEEIDRVIDAAINKKKPVYILIPKDVFSEKIMDKGIKLEKAVSDKNILDEVIKQVSSKINNAINPVIIAGLGVNRYNLKEEVTQLLNKINSPITTMLTGKGCIDEQHPNYIGLYCGNLINDKTRKIVESSDCIINIGEPLGDMNTGAFTAKINPLNMIEISGDNTKINMAIYEKVLIKDVLEGIINKVDKKERSIPQVDFKYSQSLKPQESKLNEDYYYHIFQKFIKDGDTILAENGTLAFGISQLNLPSDIKFIFQAQWGSIGYATGATIGAGIADKKRRLILFTGEGAHQMTVQAISTMLRNDLKPIVFVLNNNGYTIERYLNTQVNSDYNYLEKWNYNLIPRAFGKDAFVATVKTDKELYEVIDKIEEENKMRMCYIELVGGMMDAPLLVKEFGNIANKKQ